MESSLINKEILEKLNSNDKSILLDSLATLIQSTYGTEEEFKKLQNEFNNLKALYEWVIELIPQAIWVIENDLSIFYQNAESYALNALMQKYIEQNTLQEQVMEYLGQSYLLQSSAKGTKKIISATNITNQKRQERLASMGTISAHLAHEIRNPIGSISLLTSTLLKRGDSTIAPIALEIKKSLWRVERLINATLLFTKGVTPNRQYHNISLLQEDLHNSVTYYTYTKDIAFDFSLGSGSILVDFDLFSIVMQNFIFNAIDAIEEGEVEQGKICVRLDSNDKEWIFSFSDNGKAIENENILFEPFKSTKLKGNGLGLALCKQIIDAHNGIISFSTSPQKMFILSIPKES